MSSQFCNREPWNLIIGFGSVAAVLLVIAALTTPWLLIVPILLWAFFVAKAYLVRTIALRRKGYFSGRRKKDTWVYEERHEGKTLSLTLKVENTEPGHYELFVPTDSEWRASVPPWARERRKEIGRRISEGWKPRDFHWPDDLEITGRA